MRYYKRNFDDGITHVWILKIDIQESNIRETPLGITQVKELASGLIPPSAAIEGKVVLWLHDATDTFGIWFNGSGLAFPASTLLYLEMQHECTFRNDPLGESLRLRQITTIDCSGWVFLGQCFPTHRRKNLALNSSALRDELLQLNKSPLFQDRFGETVKFVHYAEPY
ncbi:hypothetical protein [Chitinimonas taiwanensis]|uniref:hypothetical protein n=1 Tax=Chitinimonas taiwanensis TaxID=240412 RepID=UPI001114768B|nr:hypothetical protein [Chitinimonas taiwanensis]